MILEAYMPVYIGVKIFIAYGCTGGQAGPPEVVQEALADLKKQPEDSRAVWQEVALDQIDGVSRCRTVEVFHVCPNRLTGSEVGLGLQSST